MQVDIAFELSFMFKILFTLIAPNICGSEHIGPAPSSTRWTVLCLDLQYILSTYLSRRYSYVRSIRLCANMLVKNVFTSDIVYDPGLYRIAASIFSVRNVSSSV